MQDIVQVGLIKSLKLLNFIRFEDVDIDFKHGLTIITGPNGAGKSILIQSIQLCLGASSLTFPNIKAISDVIMDGKQKTLITLIINNPKINGKRIINFDPESLLYDLTNSDTFAIHRIIKKNSNYWKINQRQIKKSHLDKLVSKIGIDPNNELIFMSQHTPDILLRTNEKDLFQKFAEATGLEDFRKKLLLGREKLKKLDEEKNFWFEKLASEESYLNKLKQQKERYKNKIELIETLKKLRVEQSWVPIIELESEEKDLQYSLNYMKKDLSILNSKIEKTKNILNELIRKKEEIQKIQNLKKKEFSALSIQCSDYRSIKESSIRKKQKINFKKIDLEKKKIRFNNILKLINNKLKNLKKTEISEQFEILKIQIKKIDKEIMQMKDEKYDLERKIMETNFQIDQINNEIKKLKKIISELKKNGITSVLSHHTLNMLNELNKPQNKKTISFLGPICLEITIKESFHKWSKAINASLRDISQDFIALNKISLKLIDEFRRKNQFDVSLGILEKNKGVKHLTEKKYSFPIQAEIIDALEGNQIVMEYISHHRNGLLSNFVDPNLLFEISKKYHMNVFTQDGFRYTPSFRSPRRGQIREIIGINSSNEKIIKEFHQKINELTNSVIKYQKEREFLQDQLENFLKRLKVKDKEKSKLKESEDVLKEDNRLILEREKQKVEEENEEILLKLENYNEKLNEIENKIIEFDKKIQYLKEQLDQKNKELDELSRNKSNLDIEFGKYQTKIGQLNGKITILNEDILKYKDRLIQISNKKKDMVKKIKQIGPRPIKIRDPSILASLITEAETLISTIEINENILEMYKNQKKKVEKYSLEVDIRNTEIQELLNIQEELFNTYRNELKTFLKTLNSEFKRLMYPYFGEIKVRGINKIDETLLEIYAAFDETPYNLNKLSAGQTALTVISFLLSLQALRKTPLKVIDEFTQRLDSSNQKQIINIIIDQFERMKNNQEKYNQFYLPQFIIITPEISNMKINYNFNHISISTTPPKLNINNG